MRQRWTSRTVGNRKPSFDASDPNAYPAFGLLDGLMAGGFFLVRTHPADLEPASLLRFLADVTGVVGQTLDDDATARDIVRLSPSRAVTWIACVSDICSGLIQSAAASRKRSWRTPSDGGVRAMTPESGSYRTASIPAASTWPAWACP